MLKFRKLKRSGYLSEVWILSVEAPPLLSVSSDMLCLYVLPPI